jgi:hypothetical protein
MKFPVSKTSLYIIGLVLVINFVLEYQYIHFLTPLYYYMGYTFDFNLGKYIISKAVLIIFLFYTLLLFKKSQFIYVVSIFILLLFYIPNSIFYSFKNISGGPFISTTLFVIIFFAIAPKKIKISFINIKQSNLDLIVILAALLCIIPIFIMGSSHVNLNTLILKDIYETRAIHKKNTAPLYNYMFMWEIKILLPMVLVYGIFRKKVFFILTGFLLLLFLFTISAHKSVYVAMFALIIFYYLGKDYISKLIRFLFYLVVLMLVVYPLLGMIFNMTLFKAMLYERVFFDQSLLTYYYFDFFHGKPIYFSESLFFNLFFTYPYHISSAYLIGSVYFHSAIQHANTGIIGDAFMSLGYTGVIIISAIFSFCFSFLNSLDLDSRFFGLFFIFLFDFANSSLLSIFLSGGFIILLTYAYLVMSKKRLSYYSG